MRFRNRLLLDYAIVLPLCAAAVVLNGTVTGWTLAGALTGYLLAIAADIAEDFIVILRGKLA